MDSHYIVGAPIQSAIDFYGRSTETNRFFEILAGRQVQSLSVLGLPRIGKTSFLKFISSPEIKAAYLPQPDRYIFILLDITLCKSAKTFYQRLFSELVLALRYSLPTALHVPSVNTISLYDIEDLLLQTGGYRVVLLLDNFDSILDCDYSLEFMTELRAATSAWEYELACITTSYLDLYTLGTAVGLPPTSPFYNIFYPSPIFLAGLDDTACKQLVCTPLKTNSYSCSDEDVAKIQQLAGSIPICVQATAVRWWHNGNFERPFLENVFKRWWDVFNNLEKTLLLKIVNNQPLTEGKVELSTSAALQKLLDFGVIVESSTTLRINGDLLAAWIKKQGGKFDQLDHTIQFQSNKLNE